jgi:hypothetical protein
MFREDGVDSADDICFEEKCSNFEEACSEMSYKFLDYFQKRLKIRKTLPLGKDWLTPIGEVAIASQSTMCLNSQWKTLGLTVFVETAQALVEGQL